MSFSQCIKCKSMVYAYEKYCNSCVEKYGVKQDEDWDKVKHFDDWEKERHAEFEKDLKNAKAEKLLKGK